jgi:hypothetical protein
VAAQATGGISPGYGRRVGRTVARYTGTAAQGSRLLRGNSSIATVSVAVAGIWLRRVQETEPNRDKLY